MEKIQLKKIQLKERSLFPANLHPIKKGCVLELDFEENGKPYLWFDGADDLATSPTIETSADMSINIKFRSEELASSNGIFEIGSYDYRIYEQNGNYNIQARNSAGTGIYLYSIGGVCGEIVDIGFSINSETGKIRAFVDGKFKREATLDGGAEVLSGTVHFGKTSGFLYADMELYNFRLFKRALSDDEMIAVQTNGYVSDDNLELALNGTAKDLSGNGNDLTVTGAIPKDTARDRSDKEPYMVLDGTDDGVTGTVTELIGNTKKEIIIDFICDDIDNVEHNTLFSAGTTTSNSAIFFKIKDGKFVLDISGKTLTSISSIQNDVRYKVRAVLEENLLSVFIDDNETADKTLTITALTTGNGDFTIGKQFTNSRYFDGKMFNAEIIVDGVTKFATDFRRKNNDDTVLPDISGNGNDGVVTGASFENQANDGEMINCTRVQGMGDLKGVELDGTSGYVNCGNDTSLNFEESVSFSILAIIKVTVPGTLCSNGANDGVKAGFKLFMGTGGLSMYIGDGVSRVSFNFGGHTSIVNDEKYHVLAVTADRINGVLTGYIDGEKVGLTADISAYNLSDITSTTDFLIGYIQNAAWFGGTNSRVKIYKDKTLSAQEVRNETLYLKRKAGLI